MKIKNKLPQNQPIEIVENEELPNCSKLPLEIITNIFSFCDPKELKDFYISVLNATNLKEEKIKGYKNSLTLALKTQEFSLTAQLLFQNKELFFKEFFYENNKDIFFEDFAYENKKKTWKKLSLWKYIRRL